MTSKTKLNNKMDLGLLLSQKSIINNFIGLNDFIDAIPNIYLILNDQRQIVYFNQSAQRLLSSIAQDESLGIKAGDLFNCIHSIQTESGCGTTEFCVNCGANIAINSAISGQKSFK